MGKLRLFKNLCQSGKITNTQGNTDAHRNVEQFARDRKADKSIGGKDGSLGFLIKQLRPFKNLCQSGKITNTQGHTDEYKNRCRTVCS